jgi:predicted MFS family arabinose efflux permease
MTTSASALGLAVGSPMGVLISGFLNWRYIFYLNIPLLILAVIFAKRVIPDDSPGETVKRDFDWRSALLYFTAIFLLVYAINRATEEGWTSSRSLGPSYASC